MYQDRLTILEKARFAWSILLRSARPWRQDYRAQELKIGKPPDLYRASFPVGLEVHRRVCAHHTIERGHNHEAVRTNQFAFGRRVHCTATTNQAPPIIQLD